MRSLRDTIHDRRSRAGDETGQELHARSAARDRTTASSNSSSDSSTSISRSRIGARRATASSPKLRSRSNARASGSKPRRSRRRRRATSARRNAILRRETRRKSHRSHGPPPAGRATGRRNPRADLDRAHGRRRCLRRQGMARAKRRRRGRLPYRSGSSAASAASSPSTPSARSQDACEGLRRPEVHGQPRRTKGCSRKRWTPPPSAIPTSSTSRS